MVALWRLGTVEDCAKVVEFLAADLSDYVTGGGDQGSRMRSLWYLSLLGNDTHRFGNGYFSQRR